MRELYFTRKDFRVEWFSGTGAGGQHRNKHQNCCRITHIETGLRAQGTESRERAPNQRRAFMRLSRLVIAHYAAEDGPGCQRNDTVIRTYHAVRNEVRDKASGLRREYRQVVVQADLGEMIESRHRAMAGSCCG